jgi:hypothetical protein
MRKPGCNAHPRALGVALTWLATAAIAGAAHAGDWSFTRIADDDGAFMSFPVAPSIAADGSVAYLAQLDSGPISLNLGSGGATSELLRTGGAGLATVTGPPAQDGLGRVYVLGQTAGGPAGVYRVTPGQPPALLYGGTGISQHTVPRANATGVVAFRGFNGVQRIYTGSGAAPDVVAAAGVGGVVILDVRSPINTSGNVAYRATLGTGEQQLRRNASGVAPSLIATTAGDVLRFIGQPDLNDANEVVFAAELDGGLKVIRIAGDSTTLTRVSSGPHYTELANPALALDGSIVFHGVLADGSGEGLFSGPNALHQTVIRTGDFIDGSTLVSVAFDAVGLNDAGQVAFRATLADGRTGVYRADPGATPRELRLRRAKEALAAESVTPAHFSFERGQFRAFAGDVRVLPGTPAAQARRFAEEHRDLLDWTSPDLSLTPARLTDIDGDATLVRFAQRYKGLPVFASGLHVSVAPVGTSGARITTAVAALIPELPDLDILPAFPPGPCIDAARLEVGDPDALPSSPVELFVFDGRLVAQAPGAPPLGSHLVYRVHLSGPSGRRGFLVDAHTAEVVLSYGLDESASPWMQLELRDALGLTFTDGACLPPFFPGLGDEDGLFAVPGDPEVQALHEFAVGTFDFYAEAPYFRCSYDGLCGGIMMFAKASTTCDDCPNARFSPGCNQMEYSTGLVGRDIVTHEFTHGVIRHTSDLIYKDQPGALNESYADTMAWLEDIGDDLLAEDVSGGGGPYRSMSSPPDYGQPDKLSDWVVTDDDEGGVHTNSGIMNKAHYMIRQGGRHNGVPSENFPPILGLTFLKTGPLVYNTFRMLMPFSSLQLAADVTIFNAENYAAQGTYGFTPANACSVRNAFASVELASQDGNCDGNPDDLVDTDGDGWDDASDNCPDVWNATQANCDQEGAGDACSPDNDGDGHPNGCDNCTNVYNPSQQDYTKDGQGDACDVDDDGDGVNDAIDNCLFLDNSEQTDSDGEGTGDGCDADLDDDGWFTFTDNCPFDYNPDLLDTDQDGKGDVCDGCPTVYDPPQSFLFNPWDPSAIPTPDEPDSDGDGTPDACDFDQFGLASLLVGGIGYNPSVGVVPAGGGSRTLQLSAPAETIVAVPIPACEPDPVGPIAFSRNTRLQITADGLAPDVRAFIVDDSGQRRTELTPGGARGERGAWISPDCGRGHRLELQTGTFAGTDSFVLAASYVEQAATGNPYTQRPASGIPQEPLPDADADGVLDFADKCPNAADPDNLDTGAIAAPGPDGIGNVCQCGDADDDGDGDVRDFAFVARQLQGLPPGANLAKCDVVPAPGLTADDLRALREALAHIPPGIGQICPAAF